MNELESIAVVGMAANLPKAPNLESFWENLVNGVECMTDLTHEDVRARGETKERLTHPSYVRRRPLMVDMEYFDAGLFGMTPRDAELRDPQHRIFLETCFSALEHAGYDSHRYDGAIGLYAGVNANRYVDLHLRQAPKLVATVGELAIETTNHPDYVTTFTSYKLGLRGPSMTIATACSSSLVSLHQACQALRLGECDMALAGGVEVEWPYGIGYVHNQGGIYSSDGYCRPFDARADGTVFGSGAGAVLLKRTADALADGDTIYAVVRGSAINNDGADKVGFSAPSIAGQATCVAEALVAADVPPATISYVEAHGTATKLGDPIEVQALTQAYRAVGGELGTAYCGLGSVKSNIGHLGPASGIAGFIKTVLALHHETLPPSINFSEPNPRLELAETPFEVVAEVRAWRRADFGVRRAGVSSFGIGGTNAHVVLEEAPEQPAPAPTTERQPELLVVSARGAEALGRAREGLAQHLAWNDAELSDVGHTLRVGRRVMEVREAVVAETATAAAAAFGEARGASAPVPEHVVFAFPGQGSQHAHMAAGLWNFSGRFRQRFDECLTGFSDLTGRDFHALWRGDLDEAALAETILAQPLLYSVEYALADFLREAGVSPSAVIGHSLGEIVAGVVAGVFSPEDGMRVVAERARLMQTMPQGAMVAAMIADSDVRDYLCDGVSVAAVNGPQEVVLSGASAPLSSVLERLTGVGVTTRRLATSHAYHSTMMNEAAGQFREVLERVALSAPSVPLVSCAVEQVEGDQLTAPGFWADQLIGPVQFARAAREVLGRNDQALVLEVGPGAVLTGLFRGTPAVRRGRALVRPVLGKKGDPKAEYGFFLRLLGDLWQGGLDLDLGVLSERAARRVALPGYPFERRRHFVDRPVPDERTTEIVDGGEEMLDVARREVTTPNTPEQPRVVEVTWAREVVRTPSPADRSSTVEDALTLLPPDTDTARKLLALVQRSGLRPVRVRGARAGGTSREDHVDFTDRAAVFGYVGGLAARRQLPATIVHGLLFGDQDERDSDESAGVKSLLWLVQAVQRYRGEAGLADVRLVVITSRGADVTGAESIDPARAMVSGLLRTIELETRSIRCELLDVAARSSTAVLVDVLRNRRHRQSAVRGTDVWLPALQPLVANGSARQAITHRGVHLITGGLGALGRASALALANTGFNPRLVLMGRSVDTDEPVAEFIGELESCGAEVELIAADVADESQMKLAFDQIHKRFGSINGVLHAAGVAGDGLLELRTEQEVDAVLRAKVDGSVVLQGLLESESDLQYVVHFGSRAALTGLVGSGDYAAANAYLNAVARRDGGGDRLVVTVNWPGWAEAGMAVRTEESDVDSKAETATVEYRWTGAEWFLDEHRAAGAPMLPGTGYVDLLLTSAFRLGITPPQRPVAITELVFTSPLVVTEPTDVVVEFSAENDGFRAVVRARSAVGGSWTRHAQAVVTPVDREATAIDPTEFASRMDTGEVVNIDLAGTVVEFGDRWRAAAEVVREEDGYLAELALAEPHRGDLGDHYAHPALLDVATSLAQSAADQPHLPFYYREAVFFRKIPSNVRVVNRPVTASGAIVAGVSLYDQAGDEVARISGFTMRPVDRADFHRTVLDSNATGSQDEQLGRLLSPRAGAALLIRIIQSASPAVVTVLQPDEALPGYVSLEPDGRAETMSRAGRQSDEVTAQPPAPVRREVPTVPPAPVAGAGSGAIEDRMRVLWEQMLGLLDIAGDADFFELGGTSLAAVQLVSRIQEEFGVQLSVGMIFEIGTIDQLANEIRRQGGPRE